MLTCALPLRSQYIVTADLAEQSYTGSAETPVTLPSGSNLALQSIATASSQAPSQPASAAIDGNVQGYPGNYTAEWASANEGVGAWLLLSWPQPVNLTSLALYDRPNLNGAFQAGLAQLHSRY